MGKCIKQPLFMPHCRVCHVGVFYSMKFSLSILTFAQSSKPLFHALFLQIITMMKLAVLAAVAGSAAAFAPSNSGGRFINVLCYYFFFVGLIQPGLEMEMTKLFSAQELSLRLVRTNLVVDSIPLQHSSVIAVILAVMWCFDETRSRRGFALYNTELEN